MDPRRLHDKKSKCLAFVQQRIPVTYWLPRYNKLDFLPDLIAGITVGLTLIPQSIAYASLAGLEPQQGLYSAFLGTFVYIIFGTVKEVNLGPKALLSLLTFNYTHKLGTSYAVLLCFLCGCLELLCGVLQLGFLVNFVSAPVILSFTWASCLVIASAQIKGLLGLSFISESLFQTWQGVITHIAEVRNEDAILGVCCCIVLISLKAVKDGAKLEGKFGKVLWFILTARNALVVLICATIAGVLEKNGSTPFILTGRVTSGLPTFQAPPFSVEVGNTTMGFVEMTSELGPGVIVVSVIAVISNLAIGRAFAQGRMLDATQEMIALGLCNIAGSMVGSMPVAGAFSRSAISNASGVRSPLAGLYTGVMVILSLSLLTPYFYFIPRATLAAVLACAVISLIDLSALKPMWLSSKLDIMTCVVTFPSCLCLGIDLGLLTGVLFDVSMHLLFSTRPKIDTKLIQDDIMYLLVTPKSGVMFASADHLRSTVLKKCQQYDNVPVVIDCCHLITLDFTTAQSLKSLRNDLIKTGHDLILYQATDEVLNVLTIICDPEIIYNAINLSELHIFLKDLL